MHVHNPFAGIAVNNLIKEKHWWRLRKKLKSIYRSIRQEVFSKKSVLRNFAKFTGKYLRHRFFFNKVSGLRPKACTFVKKESLALVFFCEFCEISKNTFFYRISPMAASAFSAKLHYLCTLFFSPTLSISLSPILMQQYNLGPSFLFQITQ